MEKDLEPSPSLSNCSKDSRKLLPLLISYQLAKFDDFLSCGSKDILKNLPCLITNTHCDVTNSLNHGMVKNTKT